LNSSGTRAAILGVGAFVHDTATCLIDSATGQVLYALAEERLTNVKHDSKFPIGTARQAMAVARDAGYSITDVAINHDPARFITGTLAALVKEIIEDADAADTFVSALVGQHQFPDYYVLTGYSLATERIEQLIEKLGLPPDRRTMLRRRLTWHYNWAVKYRLVANHYRQLLPDAKIHFVPHHTAHAAGAFLASGMADACILVMDGQGESDTISVFSGSPSGIDLRSATAYPHSLGLFYLACTQHLGFSLGDEYKVMGMAAYGQPSLHPLLSSMAEVTKQGRFVLHENEYFLHSHMQPKTGHSGLKFTERFCSLVPPRDPQAPIEQIHFDFAASVQRLTEQAGVELARAALAETGSTNLVLCGGVALNGLMNERIRRESGCRSIFIYPAAGDDGTAVGAAQSLAKRSGITGHSGLQSCFYGNRADDDEVLRALSRQNIRYSKPENIASTIAAALAKGKIVARFTGRSEFGPRALGDRSILADPRQESMRDTLNIRIKHRESFRPFAPACLAERAKAFFDLDCDSPFMLLICSVTELAKKTIPAVVHRDGTARVQTVNRQSNPEFYSVIEEFDRLTGVPVVINTSFNVNGETIVDRAADAIESFLFMDIDYLAINGYWVAKDENAGHGLASISHDEYLGLRRKRFAEDYREPLNQFDLARFDRAFFNDESMFGSPATAAAASYRVGETISFAQGGAAAGFQLAGWSVAEPWGVWSNGPAASLEIPIDTVPKYGVEMTCIAHGFTSALRPEQTVHVIANGEAVAHWTFKTTDEADRPRRATISAGTMSIRMPLRVDFLISHPTSPLELNQSEDPRRLGIGIRELILKAVG